MAPCDQDGVLSLAVCKVGIRKTAKVGDWLLGTLPKDVHSEPGLLYYVAKIGDIQTREEYYSSPEERRDKIYRVETDGSLVHKGEIRFHNRIDKENLQRKDSAGTVLLSTTYKVFDENNPPDTPPVLQQCLQYWQGYKKVQNISKEQMAELWNLVKKDNNCGAL
jgi:hypothetical protein